MFLKRKIDLFKKSSFLCLFLIMGSFAATLNAAEKAKFIVNDEPFIFRNQKLIPTEKYTPEKLQKKIGKADGSSNKENFGEIFYKDEGVAFSFDSKNYFCGFSFFLTKEDMCPVKIYDLEITKNDTYESIQKKIKALNITYNLYEQEGNNHLIDMEFVSKKFGKVNTTIVCSRYEKQNVLLVAVVYMDIANK
ncbi:hypothetical protein H0R90_03490 [Treponema putidum]|uniref:hypothetical protein n=1 Tax=Treponema putidum TaxID=221027 RepID=UPI0004F65DEA|nr:hypothetical protein [Treponema putidum]AIN94499.1 hypothetical protein JO40_10695 [Treponema putidum]TWI78907.1 hypothetical protein JM98_00491 [Treponema putidum]